MNDALGLFHSHEITSNVVLKGWVNLRDSLILNHLGRRQCVQTCSFMEGDSVSNFSVWPWQGIDLPSDAATGSSVSLSQCLRARSWISQHFGRWRNLTPWMLELCTHKMDLHKFDNRTNLHRVTPCPVPHNESAVCIYNHIQLSLQHDLHSLSRCACPAARGSHFKPKPPTLAPWPTASCHVPRQRGWIPPHDAPNVPIPATRFSPPDCGQRVPQMQDVWNGKKRRV